MLDSPRAAPPVVAIEEAVIPLPDAAAAIGPYTLDVPPAAVTSIVGPSGSGKTTLVRAIVERRRPVAGRIVIDAHAAEIAYVPQNVSDRLNRVASAMRHMRDVSRRLGRTEAERLLAQFRIPADALGRPAGTLSAGQQQRLVLLIMLLRQPRLIILDEPTSALDVEMRNELAQILRRMAKDDGLAILVATHHLPFVSVVSDRIWRLARIDGEAAS